jgi:hypothetical protein
MYELLVSGLAVVLVLVTYKDWLRTKDPFYPTIYLCPQLAFVYVFYPFQGMSFDREMFEAIGGGQDQLILYQTAIFGFVLSMVVGIRVGSYRRHERVGVVVPKNNERMIYGAALLFGGTGIAAWVYMLENVGGFAAAYGSFYGGGWAESGYVREAMFLGLATPPLVMLARRNRGLHFIDWSVIAVAVAPIIIHGLLGARRGPTFIVLATVGAGYILLFRKRVSLVTIAAGGFATGLLLLFLLANRDGIFLGSEKSLDAPLLDYFSPSHSNEYLYGSAIFRFVNLSESFHGSRVATHIFGHMVPAQIWPDKYADLVRLFGIDTNLEENAGVPDAAIASVVGWIPSRGAAPAMFGDFWLEFGVGSFVASFLVGWTYGRFWRLSKNNASIEVVYLLFVALSLYLTMQTIEAWLYRAILFGVPSWFTVRSIADRVKFRSDGVAVATRER